MRKITVIGTGRVGSCISYEIANSGIVDKLVLIDVNKELAKGNAEDIRHSLAFRNNTEVSYGDYVDANYSDVIVVVAGKSRTSETKSRIDLFNFNKKIIQDIASKLKDIKEDFVVVTLTNPVDLMNYLMWKYTHFERRRILGSGGQLDSARFKVVLSEKYKIPVRNIEAYVIGEHGVNQVLIFSKVKFRGERINFTKEEKEEIDKHVKNSALNIISKKGATIFGPTSNTVDIIKSILCDEKKLFMCSAILKGEYSLKGISIGVPVIVGRTGIKKIKQWDLDESEKNIFCQSAKVIEQYIEEINY